MKKLLPLLLVLLVAIGSKNVSIESPERGGLLKVNLIEDFRSLFPPSILEEPGRNIGSNIYEGLVKYDAVTLQIVPSLAKSWDVSADGKIITFHLRTNALFHDDECFDNGIGRRMVAEDVRKCFAYLLHDSPMNFSGTFIFKGAIDNEKGFAAPNDSTFVITISQPCSWLLPTLTTPTCWIYPPEALAKYSDDMRIHAVGTGPFRLKRIMEGDFVVLTRNENYWRTDAEGNQLPYLDGIKYTFIKDRRSELLSFRTGELDLILNVDLENVSDAFDLQNNSSNSSQFQLFSDTALTLYYYGFNTKRAPFNNVKVRQAFSHAINKQKLVKYVTRGDAVPAGPGFIPPGIPGYRNTDVDYNFDVDKARQLLREAGYPNGSGFPSITLQTNAGGGDRNSLVAEYVVNQLKENLGITVKIEVVPFAQHLETVETGKVGFWRMGWIIDYADPRGFLALAYGKNVPAQSDARSSINPTRFTNPDFDKYYELGSATMDESMRMKYYKQAEQIAMENAFIIPLYYPIVDELLSPSFRNYSINGLRVHDLSEVWKDK